MNKTLQEGLDLATGLDAALKNKSLNCDVIIGTPFIHLASVAAAIDTKKIGVAAENCADKASGAYTGEVSAAMVKSTGAEYVILGHSERREYYNETPEILKEKVLLALENGLKVIFCIGESLAEREANKQNEVVKAELEGSVFNLSAEDFSKIIIAYEPRWAIGAGLTPTHDEIATAHTLIANTLTDMGLSGTPILYGASVKGSNAAEIMSIPNVNGVLVGGASLKSDDFIPIITSVK